MVTIVDPHIRRDEEYYIYKEAAAGGHLVLNKDGAVYEGWCWPGTQFHHIVSLLFVTVVRN